RAAMEADVRAARGVRAPRQVARVEQRRDAGNIRLESEREQIELQLDVLVEGFRHADRHGGRRRIRRSLRRDLEAALDLAHVVEVLLDASPVVVTDLALQARKVSADRV